ncbi:MAG TPA: hypothetical protein VMZ53_20160, partial [Kofleriaceae bacterium]|nr:hypothetical protein [Kofleriaceae bacterium]
MRIGVSLVAIVVSSGVAYAQAVDRRYAEEPTRGLALPTTGLAGEHDARAVVANAGGLPLLRGPEMTLALELEDPEVATSAGPGFGLYVGTAGGGGLLPRYGVGMGFEWLRPSRAQVSPDPGQPFRFTLGMALGLGAKAGFGLAWHHFSAEGNLDGEDTFDLGLSTRWGSRLGIGATLIDVATKPIGGAPVQRRYELEALWRPLATDRLEVGIGGRVGETRGDLDGWLRLSARIARGVFLLGEVESRQVYALQDSPMGLTEEDGRELRVTAGLEVSFGAMGVTALGSGLRNDLGTNHPLGSTLIVRASGQGPASVLGDGDHIERVELSGTIGSRELTSIVLRLRSIAHDSTAKAVIVMFDGADGGWATLQELRDELLAVKKAGKKVFA